MSGNCLLFPPFPKRSLQRNRVLYRKESINPSPHIVSYISVRVYVVPFLKDLDLELAEQDHDVLIH